MLQGVVKIAQHLARAFPLNAVELNLSSRGQTQQAGGDYDANSKLFEHEFRTIIQECPLPRGLIPDIKGLRGLFRQQPIYIGPKYGLPNGADI
jgi:hypothetical protein